MKTKTKSEKCKAGCEPGRVLLTELSIQSTGYVLISSSGALCQHYNKLALPTRCGVSRKDLLIFVGKKPIE